MLKENQNPTKRGLLFILSAPAGTGKTTLMTMLANEFPRVVASISFTTRLPRDGEEEGRHYFFISKDEFEKKIKADEFLEYVELYGEFYGTSRLWVEGKLAQGIHVVLVIDTQGAKLLKGKIPAITIFVVPPSLEELEKRLRLRKTEDEKVIERRLAWAKKELTAQNIYDYLIVNDDLAIAYEALRSILIAEEHRIR